MSKKQSVSTLDIRSMVSGMKIKEEEGKASKNSKGNPR
jgi:hypothetical protein